MLYILGGVFLTSLAANKYSAEFSLNKVLIAIPLCFVNAIAVVYKREILPEISESTLHIISIIYLYSLFLNTAFYHNVLTLIIALLPVMIVAYYLFTKRVATPSEKLFLYCLNITFLCNISFFNLKRIVNDISWMSNLTFNFSFATSIFFITGILFYVLIYLINLIWIIPLPAKDASKKEMEDRIKKQASVFKKKVSDIQAYPSIVLVSSVLIIILMVLSIRFNVIPHSFNETFLLIILVLDTKINR